MSKTIHRLTSFEHEEIPQELRKTAEKNAYTMATNALKNRGVGVRIEIYETDDNKRIAIASCLSDGTFAHLFELTTALQQIGVKDITTEAETLDKSPIKNKPWLLTRFTAYGTMNE